MLRVYVSLFASVLLCISGCDIGDTSPQRMPLNPPGIAPLLDYNEASRPVERPQAPPPAQTQPPAPQEQPQPQTLPPPPPPPSPAG